MDNKELWGNSYVFDPGVMKWVVLNELSLFKRLGLSFKLSEEEFQVPKRVPAQTQQKESPTENLQNMETHYLDDYITIFQNQIDKLLDNNLKLVDENIKFKVEKNETKAEYEMLKFQTNLAVQTLENENRSLQNQVADQTETIESQRAELREIKSNYQDQLEEQHEKLNELFEIQKDLSLKVHELTQSVSNKEKLIIKLEDHISSLQKEKHDLEKSSAEKYNEETGKLSQSLKASEEKYESQILEMKENHQKELHELAQKHAQDVEATMEQFQEQIKHLKMEIEVKDHQIQTGKMVKSPEDGEKIKSIIAEKDKKIHSLIEKQNLIKNKYKEDFEKAQKTFHNYKQVIDRQKKKQQDLNSNVIQLNDNLKKVQHDLEHEKIKSQRLETLMEQQANLNEIADEKAKVQDEFVVFKELGKLFEISNAPHWEVRNDEYKGKMFSLKEVRDFIEDEVITPDTFVKREGKWWKKAKEVHELFLELREKEENGELHYYIERQSLRVPCGDKVDVLTDDAEFEGICINISTGGCLIQIQDLNNIAFKNDDEITIVFKSESLLFEFEIIGTIRNVDQNDKTLGIQFFDITDEEFDTIAFYIDSFADKLEEEAA